MPPPIIGNASSTMTSTQQRVQLKAKRGLARELAGVSKGDISEARNHVSAPAVENEMAALPLSTERAYRFGFQAGDRVVAFELKNTKPAEPVSTESEGYGSNWDSWGGEDGDMFTKEHFPIHHGSKNPKTSASEARLAVILEDVEGERNLEKADVSETTEVVKAEPVSALASEKPVEETTVATQAAAIQIAPTKAAPAPAEIGEGLQNPRPVIAHRQSSMTSAKNKGPVQLTLNRRVEESRLGKPQPRFAPLYSTDLTMKKIAAIKQQIAVNKQDMAERKNMTAEAPLQKFRFTDETRNFISKWENINENKVSAGVDSSNTRGVAFLKLLWEVRASNKLLPK